MKKNKRDLLFSTLSVLMIAFLIIVEISSGMAVYAVSLPGEGGLPSNDYGQNSIGESPNRGIGDVGDPGDGNLPDGNLPNDDSPNGDNGISDNDPDGNMMPDDNNNAADGHIPDGHLGENSLMMTADMTEKDPSYWGWALAVLATLAILVLFVAWICGKRRTKREKR